MLAQLLNTIHNQVAQDYIGGITPALILNPKTPINYPYFKEDLEYVKDAMEWIEGSDTYEALLPIIGMVEVYASREPDGEANYLIIENSKGMHLFSCGWGMPATLTPIKIEDA